VLRAIKNIFWGPGPDIKWKHLSDPKGLEWVPLVVLGLCLIVFGAWPSLLLDFIDLATSEYLPAVAGKALEVLR